MEIKKKEKKLDSLMHILSQKPIMKDEVIYGSFAFNIRN